MDLVAKLAAAAMLLAAAGPWPYDYYTLLRFVVCAVTARASYVSYQRAGRAVDKAIRANQERWMWAFGLIAVLFNPFRLIYFTRETWTIIDVTVALLIIYQIVTERRLASAARRKTA